MIIQTFEKDFFKGRQGQDYFFGHLLQTNMREDEYAETNTTNHLKAVDNS